MSKECDAKEEVTKLIRKAGDAGKSDDALKFSQAALNAANAMNALRQSKD